MPFIKQPQTLCQSNDGNICGCFLKELRSVAELLQLLLDLYFGVGFNDVAYLNVVVVDK